MGILSSAMRFAVLVFLLAGLASGCGQRGELYLRDSPPPGVKPPRAEAYEPVPYPPPAGDAAEKKR